MRALVPLVVVLSACKDGGIGIPEDSAPVADTDTDVGETDDTEPIVECPDAEWPGTVAPGTDACSVPDGGPIEVEVEWELETFTDFPSFNHVMSSPVVADLDGDGIPEVIFVCYQGSTTGSVVRAVRGDDGTVVWSVQLLDGQGQGGLAVADLDGDGSIEVVASTVRGVTVIDARGRVGASRTGLLGMYGTCDQPSIADLDGDGVPEVLIGNNVLSDELEAISAGGYGRGGSTANVGTASFAVDIDGNGAQELVVPNAAYLKNGNAVWHTSSLDAYPVVADLDGDGVAEIVATGNGVAALYSGLDGSQIWSHTVSSTSYYCGPATVADFDGDGVSDIAFDCGNTFFTYDATGHEIWHATVNDDSSGVTGATAFDFDGDGVFELIYADEDSVWIFAGPDGDVLFHDVDHANGTWLEYPTVADIDGDGQGEFLVVNDQQNGSGRAGIVAYGAGGNTAWNGAPTHWNQYNFDGTGFGADGSVATAHAPARRVRAVGELAGSEGGVDLDVSVADTCAACESGALTVWVQPGNHSGFDSGGDVSLVVTVTLLSGDEVDGPVVPVGPISAERFEDAVRVDITGHDPRDVASVRIDVVTSEGTCRPEDDSVVVEGPFCGGV